MTSAKVQLTDVVNFLHRLNLLLVQHYSSKISLMVCAVKTMAVHTRKYKELQDDDARAEQVRMVARTVIQRITDQLKVVRQKTVLSKEDAQKMIEYVQSELKSLELYSTAPHVIATSSSNSDLLS
jgi:esterase/lipase